MKLPLPTESVCAHGGGDWSQIAAWLFDCLDQKPPPPGGQLHLYLCHHPDDSRYFGSTQRDELLLAALGTVYQQERQWDGGDYGDLRFDLKKEVAPTRLCLQSRASQQSAPAATTPSTTDLEFHWAAAPLQAARGTLALFRQWLEPLTSQTLIVAELKVPDAKLAPHRERWQCAANWGQPVVYLPEGRTELLLGSLVGCDLYLPHLTAPLAVSYESPRNEWSLRSLAWRGRRDRQSGDFTFSLPGAGGRSAVTVHGHRLPAARKLEEQERENRLPQHALEIIGCVLPLPFHEGGYGIVPEDLPSSLPARVALRLPDAMGWLYRNEQRGEVYWWREGLAAPGRPLAKHPRATKAALPPDFYGGWQLELPLSAQLASGSITENIPDDLFPRYRDSAHGRAPARLVTTDGRRYQLIFNPLAKHPIYVKTPAQTAWRRYPHAPDQPIELGEEFEFILGTTHYRLRRLPEIAPAGFATVAQFSTGGKA